MSRDISRTIKFEGIIKDFMNNLGFDDVVGASDFLKIKGVKINVCVGHEKTLFIIACLMRKELKKGSVREKIINFRERTEDIESTIKEKPLYEKYTKFCYILATKNFIFFDADIDYAKDKIPQIYLWDDNFIDYYLDLYSKIKQYAKYNLLSDLHVKPETRVPVSIPAFRILVEKDVYMYNFVIYPKELLEISYVARREVKKEWFYQRIIDKSKIKKISAYINEGKYLPNNIIISLSSNQDKKISFQKQSFGFSQRTSSSYGVEYGILKIPYDYRSCWIIDGQHRLYAFVDVNKTAYVPVTAFENLDMIKQCRIFIDINQNQKQVSSDLVWDLQGDLMPTEEEGIISNTIKQLNKKEPLIDKFYYPSGGMKNKKRKITIAGICDTIKKCGLANHNTVSRTENPFVDEDIEVLIKNLTKALLDYFKIIKNLLPIDWEKGSSGIVLSNSGFNIMIKIFEKIVSRLKDKGKPTKEDYLFYLKPLAEFFKEQFSTKDAIKSKFKDLTNSQSGRDNKFNEFLLLIKRGTNDDDFGGKIETPYHQVCKELESRLIDMINSEFSNEDNEEWLKDISDKSIYGQAKHRMKKNKEEDITQAYKFLTLGNCFGILEKNAKRMFQYFKIDEIGFEDDASVREAFRIISKVRNFAEHPKEKKLNKYDPDKFQIFISQVNSCINEYFSKDEEENN